MNVTSAEPNVTSSVNSTEPLHEASNSSQYEDEEEIVDEDMEAMVRIVSGEDCPPGQCPWQVSLP